MGGGFVVSSVTGKPLPGQETAAGWVRFGVSVRQKVQEERGEYPITEPGRPAPYFPALLRGVAPFSPRITMSSMRTPPQPVR